jgi:hypothetical protein
MFTTAQQKFLEKINKVISETKNLMDDDMVEVFLHLAEWHSPVDELTK